MDNNTVKICVYGSLRKGGFNFERFEKYFPNIETEKKNVINFKYLKTTSIIGYDLYDLGLGYPCCIEGKNKLIVDILEISEECFRTINGMEIDAGYKPIIIEIDGEKVTMYIFKKPFGTFVESGDWISHIKK